MKNETRKRIPLVGLVVLGLGAGVLAGMVAFRRRRGKSAPQEAESERENSPKSKKESV